jgi:hypothetical protein
MIEQVVRQCLKVADVDTIVVTDSDEVLAVLRIIKSELLKQENVIQEQKE